MVFLKLAVGDLISSQSAAGVALSFQPALTVGGVIMSFTSYNSWTRFTDGALVSTGWNKTNGTVDQAMNCKIAITNSYYITMDATAAQSHSCSGIQIK